MTTPLRYVENKIAEMLAAAPSDALDAVGWSIGAGHTVRAQETAARHPSTALAYSVGVTEELNHVLLQAVVGSPVTAYLAGVAFGPHDSLREAAAGHPFTAYLFARDVDDGATPVTRDGVLNSAQAAYLYARDVVGGCGVDEALDIDAAMIEALAQNSLWAYTASIDFSKWWPQLENSCLKSPRFSALFSRHLLVHSDSLVAYRRARDLESFADCPQSPCWAYQYALNISDETARAVAIQSPYYAVLVALYVDGEPRADTRAAACHDAHCALHYATLVEGPHAETREAAAQEVDTAFLYATEVDQGAHDITREAVSGTLLGRVYEHRFE